MMADFMFADAYEAAVEKIIRISGEIGVSFPQVVPDESGIYNREDPAYWTGGFWGGLLWLAYRASGKRELFELACEIEQAQDTALEEFTGLHHDVGFMWLPTAVTHYRETGCEASRVRGLKAASILASRFNLAGKFLRAWNEEQREDSTGLAIIDCLMNLPLLYWASEATGDPRFRQIAIAHTDTVQSTFVRTDFTVPHIMRFNPETGKTLGAVSGQGKHADSVWSRGQAWAIYGFATAYQETGRTDYGRTAYGMAKRFFENLPEDKIPLWDFCADEEERCAKDSSAACIAASGMLKLAPLLKEKEEREQMEGYAKELLAHLIRECASFGSESQGIIKNGTVNFVTRRYVNVPIIYGDFYFLEALGRLKGLQGIF